MTIPGESLLNEMVAEFRRIGEPELRQIKEWIVLEATNKLRRLAESKSSPELPTDAFYQWLLPAITGACAGSEVWAISMLPDCEYDGSLEEDTFLAENINASRRGVFIRRVFVIPRSKVDSWFLNRGVVAHHENRSQTLQARITTREHLERTNPALLGVIGEGLIAFGSRVAQRDVIASDGTIRGRVTMEAHEIETLHEAFKQLWSEARDIATAIKLGDDP